MPLRQGITVEQEQEAPTGQAIGRVAITLSSGTTYMLADSGNGAWLKDNGSDVFSLDDDVAESDRGVYRIGSTTICDF